MNHTFYEVFKYADPNFLVTFHDASAVENRPSGFLMHWHENIEILLFTSGRAVVALDNSPVTYSVGDIAVINSNVTHHMLEKPIETGYHCLIIDKRFCDFFSIPPDRLRFKSIIRDGRAERILLAIANEMTGEAPYYKSRVQAYVGELLVLLAREYSEQKPAAQKSTSLQKQTTIKKAISYISEHYEEAVTVEEIAEHAGLSKYYFCRAFKEVTGQKVFDYINMMRCSKAQNLLSTGEYNISESAFASGFNNLSYFTRTYRRYMGVVPSYDLKRQETK